ncbi:hypothetical protein E2C01_089544 [Portunus trituberculatus]|uniref:Uncharacterized protein n=1 Tax=Portunus trituberculatus TaxID=210409 RepID=A0A5B7JMP9_PORTR|nr:hypothetical protein [Portunus trituberculatus]
MGAEGFLSRGEGKEIWCRVGDEWEGGEEDNQECEERDASDGEEEMESEHWEGPGGVEESLGEIGKLGVFVGVKLSRRS